jgi:hypothetical protein
MSLLTPIHKEARIAVIAIFAFAISACSAATWQAIGQVAQAASAASGSGAGSVPSFVGGSEELLLFGGQGQKTFLGCFNCNAASLSSIFNRSSQYGSAAFITSIYNRSGQFGSTWSQFSVCNRMASDPPVIANRRGQFFGRLTLNFTRMDAVQDRRVRDWLVGVCS